MFSDFYPRRNEDRGNFLLQIILEKLSLSFYYLGMESPLIAASKVACEY